MKENNTNEQSRDNSDVEEPCNKYGGISSNIETTVTTTTTNDTSTSNNVETNMQCVMNCFCLVKNKKDAAGNVADKYQQKTVYYHGITPGHLLLAPPPPSPANDKRRVQSGILPDNKLSLAVQLSNEDNCREFVLIRTNDICRRDGGNHHHKCHHHQHHDGTSNWRQHDGTKFKEDDGLTCRICHSVTGTNYEPLVSPCLCTGSMKYVHESCLINWLKSSAKTQCELCLHELQIKKSLMPLNQWSRPSEKPVAVIWLLTFLVALTLNIISITKDASRRCTATACIIYYIVGSTGALLGFVFLVFWAVKCALYVKKWLTFNQVWKLEEKYLKRKCKPLKTPV